MGFSARITRRTESVWSRRSRCWLQRSTCLLRLYTRVPGACVQTLVRRRVRQWLPRTVAPMDNALLQGHRQRCGHCGAQCSQRCRDVPELVSVINAASPIAPPPPRALHVLAGSADGCVEYICAERLAALHTWLLPWLTTFGVTLAYPQRHCSLSVASSEALIEKLV